MIEIDNISDVLGTGKKFKKLIGVLEKGSGWVFKPTQEVRMANAKAKSLEITAKSIHNVLQDYGAAGAIATLAENNGLPFDQVVGLIERANEREANRKFEEQRNIEAIAVESTNYLQDDVSDEDVSGDWARRFFDKAKEVSDEKMRVVWAKVLSGETTA